MINIGLMIAAFLLVVHAFKKFREMQEGYVWWRYGRFTQIKDWVFPFIDLGFYGLAIWALLMVIW